MIRQELFKNIKNCEKYLKGIYFVNCYHYFELSNHYNIKLNIFYFFIYNKKYEKCYHHIKPQIFNSKFM